MSQSTPAESVKSFWIILGSKPRNQLKNIKHEHLNGFSYDKVRCVFGAFNETFSRPLQGERYAFLSSNPVRVPRVTFASPSVVGVPKLGSFYPGEVFKSTTLMKPYYEKNKGTSLSLLFFL